MAELLRDNMEVCRREEGTPKPSRRAVPDLLSWVTCFGAYASVVTEKQPERVKELWANQTLIVREARRCGGKGWQAYDSMFRQQAANNSKVVWSQLNSSLYATSFLANQNQRGRTCPHCMETDHAAQNCALAPPTPPSTGRDSRPRYSERGERRRRDPASSVKMACFDWNDGKCSSLYCRFRHVCATCGVTTHTDLKCSARPTDRDMAKE